MRFVRMVGIEVRSCEGLLYSSPSIELGIDMKFHGSTVECPTIEVFDHDIAVTVQGYATTVPLNIVFTRSNHHRGGLHDQHLIQSNHQF